MSEVQRYVVGWSPGGAPETHPEGEWVRYTDHARRVGELEAMLAKANAGFEEYERKFYLAQDRAEAAEADAGRLDWLARYGAGIRQDPGDKGWYLEAPYNAAWRTFERFHSPRSAIDAALAAGVGGGE